MHAGTAMDYRKAARRKLPRMLFDYLDGGAIDEVTLRRNVEDMAGVELRQRVLRDCSGMKLSRELFGQRLSMPLILAPIGMAGFQARRAEVQAARAAEKAGIPLCLSTVSVCPIEEVQAAVKSPPWFQLYMVKDRGRMADLLARAQAKGPVPLLFTVDMPAPGLRHRDGRSGFAAEAGFARSFKRLVDGALHPQWVWDVWVHGRPHSFGNLAGVEDSKDGLASYWKWIGDNFDPSCTWKDLEWLRDHWKGPILLKGVLDAEDADLAVKAGMDGIVVSNHGGRQLDGVSSTVAALPPIVDAVQGRMKVLVDGGIRSGQDLLKVIALGADAGLIGRPWIYAVAAEGEAGVLRLLRTMRRELQVAMALTGCRDLNEANRSLIAKGP